MKWLARESIEDRINLDIFIEELICLTPYWKWIMPAEEVKDADETNESTQKDIRIIGLLHRLLILEIEKNT